MDLYQACVVLHLLDPDGRPVMAPIPVPVVSGRDKWYARDTTGSTDMVSAGAGGVAKVSVKP